MNQAAPLPEDESTNYTALILSALVHVLLIGALFFGVQWKSQAPSAVSVEVWRAAPSATVKVDTPPAPPPKPEPQPEPRPEPKPEPKPVPKAEPAPTPKPDIAVKDEKKKEEPKPKKDEPKKEDKKPEPKKDEPKKDEPKPKKDEPKKPEPAPRPSFDDELKRELKQTQQQSQQQKAVADARARADAEASLQGQLKAEQAAAGRASGINTWSNRIIGKVRGNIALPPSIRGNPEGVYVVTQLPSGEVIDFKVRKSSGNAALDAAVERAFRKSSPLPKPDQADIFQRELEIKYRPFEE